MFTGSQIRETFLRYFEQRGHKRVHSSSLVPANDPTLLFTNAGMNQFKDVFLGLEKRDYLRATTSQKCVRAGGKHNDLENVGFTNRHHTFFEMLGNFSFGDYFKREAVAYAMELITSKDWFGLPKEKLYFTIFKGEGNVPRDSDAEKFWLEAGAAKDRIYAFGMKDNFWQMGETGPCGPCSEIHYDMGPAASDQGHTDCAFGCECGRYMEIWNLVFMQFDRNSAGQLNPLPKPCVDTGAGLERLAAVLENKISNYDTDLFVPLIEAARKFSNLTEKGVESSGAGPSLRVIADHSRAMTFLIGDGVMPSNEGRGYVLRKIIRRAASHARRLPSNEQNWLHKMVFFVRDVMKGAYPELTDQAERTAEIVLTEEKRFAHILYSGLDELERYIDKEAFKSHQKTNPSRWGLIPGEIAFKLYDTFGLPLDFMQDVARDRLVELDVKGFQHAMAEQRERARASWKGGAGKAAASPAYRELKKTDFVGYGELVSDSNILAIIREGASVPELLPGQVGEIVLDVTPFYADSGGQVGDVGVFKSRYEDAILAEVSGCYQPVQGVRAHKVHAKQRMTVGDQIRAIVNGHVRTETMRNHTATHLLHAALRETLGKHVKQAGSLVDPQHLRFDFSHFTSVADEELQDIEDLTNKEVLKNTKVEVIEDVPIDVAINEYKAMALFGEKYGERVRVIKIGDFSTELCGGTHTMQTGEIGLVKILDEGSVSSGVRRVEAVTGEGSLRHFRQDHQLERVVGSLISTREASVADALKLELEKHAEEIKRLKRELDHARMKSASASTASAEENVRVVSGIKVLVHRVDNLERPQMRTLVDNLRNKLGSAVVVLGSASESDGQKKVALIVGVTKDLTARVQAGKIISPIAQKVGGSGGGRPDMAEAGGKDPAALDSALNEAYAVVESLAK